MKKASIRIGDLYAKAGRGVSYWLFLAITVFLAVNSLLFTCYFNILETDEFILYGTGGAIRNLVALCCAVAVAVFGIKWKVWRLRAFARPEWWIFGIHLTLATLWVLLAGAVQVNEPAGVSYEAVQFAAGNFGSIAQGGYLFLFPFQLGYIGLLELVYAVAGMGNETAVSLVNAVAVAFSSLFVIKITRRMFGEGAVTFAAAALVLFCVYTIPYTVFNYAILPGLCLALGGVLCTLVYLDSQRLRWLGGAAALMGLASILKSNYQIFAIGVTLVLLADLLRRPGLGKGVLLAVLVAASLWGIQLVNVSYTLRSGIRVGEGVPPIVWVAMGVSDDAYSGPGWYNGFSYYLYPRSGFDRAATSETAMEIIRERFGEMAREGSGPRFFYQKLMSEWNEPTWESLVSAWPAVEAGGGGGVLHRFFAGGRWTWLYETVLGMLHFLVMACAAAGLVLRRKRLTLEQLLPAIIVIGGFVFFALWEAKSQYVMAFSLLLAPYAAMGLVELAGLVPQVRRRMQKK